MFYRCCFCFSIFSREYFFLFLDLASIKTKFLVMSSVRCWANAGRKLSHSSQVLIFCSLNSLSRTPILKTFSTSSLILKDNSSSFSKDGFKKSVPPPPPISSGGSRGHRDGLNCPKCGDPCTHVETFVSK